MPISATHFAVRRPGFRTNDSTIAIHKHLAGTRVLSLFKYRRLSLTDLLLLLCAWLDTTRVPWAGALNRACYRGFARVAIAQGPTFYESTVVGSLQHTCWAFIKISV